MVLCYGERSSSRGGVCSPGGVTFTYPEQSGEDSVQSALGAGAGGRTESPGIQVHRKEDNSHLASQASAWETKGGGKCQRVCFYLLHIPLIVVVAGPAYGYVSDRCSALILTACS